PVLPSAARIERREGEVALLVDVTASMGARRSLDEPTMLERTKPLLHDIVDRMEALGGVRISLLGCTNMARSHVPFVGQEDYSYLRASIDRVLAVNSTPGQGTSLGQPVVEAIDKFTPGEPAKLIVLLSDGEAFVGVSRGVQGCERSAIEEAVSRATAQGVKVITVGVGERNGALAPVYGPEGEFSGEYAQLHGEDLRFYLVEDGLRELAARTGGRYFAERDRAALSNYVAQNLANTTMVEVGEERRADRPIADWFLLAALPLWALLAQRHLV
ncbi:MAG TPA: VWA domain-containing protein, partial [Anaerolineae bacterium]|nr:VWA domain-containing protein [Anaerolineae bacterium]